MQNVGVFIIQLVCVGELKKRIRAKNAIPQSNCQFNEHSANNCEGHKKIFTCKSFKNFSHIQKKNGTRIRDRQLHTHTDTHTRTVAHSQLTFSDLFWNETRESKCQMANSLGWTDIEKRSESIKSNQFRTCTRKTNKHTGTHTNTHTNTDTQTF